MFLAICVLFAGWFAVDGFVRYPAKNLKWAWQYLASIEGIPQPEALKTNPKAMLADLQQVKPGMTLDEVRAILGEPTWQKGQDLCYIGPAAFGWFRVRDEKVSEIKRVEMNGEPTENDIAWQKRIGYLMAVLTVGTLFHLVRVLGRKVVLDDDGLHIAGRQIGFDAMQSLDTALLERKGIVDIHYTSDGVPARVRLDSYAIDRFGEIVAAICARKGFTSPLKSGERASDAGMPGAS